MKKGKWIVYINKDGKRYNLGRYDTKEGAIEARETAEKVLFNAACSEYSYSDKLHFF